MSTTWTIRSAEDLGRAVARASPCPENDPGRDRSGRRRFRNWLAKLETGRSSAILDQLLRLLRRMGATATVAWDHDRG